jgi:hypothetical protein
VRLSGAGQFATVSQRPWLISDAVIVGRIFSTVQCNVLAEIDSAAIATTGSNPGELYKEPQFIVYTELESRATDKIH